METTEKIVEAYVRYVKRWATIPNIRCDGQFEIDLLAINPVTLKRYHIETSVSGSQAFSKLTGEKFDPSLLKVRVGAGDPGPMSAVAPIATELLRRSERSDVPFASFRTAGNVYSIER